MTRRPGDGETAETRIEGGRSRQMAAVKPPPVDRLEDRGEIARGGQGVIRRMFDHNLHRFVALKVMDPDLLHHPDEHGRFLDEARITGQLEHPNIVPIYDLSSGSDKTEFVMKLVEGETLSARIKRRTRTDELPRLLEIFLKVCDAIAFAHSRGVIHRDLKPANIMLGEFGQVYVMDWGCAHIVARHQEQREEGMPQRTVIDEPGTVIGTSAYMAPEQANGQTDEINERTDVFGLGAVLYEILTGSAPYAKSDDDEARTLARAGVVKHPEEVGKHRTPPPGVSAIAMRALARDPADRFQSVTQLRDEIERFLHRGAFFTPRPFPAGTLIVREGDIADEAYIITSGHCEAYREERGRKLSLRTLGPGEVFGEGALFAREPRNASIVAVDDVTAIVLTQQVLDRELGTDSWLGTFIRALTARYRDLESRDMLTRRVIENGRIANEIINHISRAGRWVRPGVLGTSWSRLWTALEPVFHITEDEALAIVERMTDLQYDASRDEITLALLSMA